MSAEEIKIIEEKVAGVVDEKLNFSQLKEKYIDWADLYEKVCEQSFLQFAEICNEHELIFT